MRGKLKLEDLKEFEMPKVRVRFSVAGGSFSGGE